MIRFMIRTLAIVFAWAGIVAMLEAANGLVGMALLILGFMTMMITLEGI